MGQDYSLRSQSARMSVALKQTAGLQPPAVISIEEIRRFFLARALGRGYDRNDEILVTELDHHANIAPWQALEKERGVKVRMVKMIPETGELDWNDFSRQLTGRTKLVAIGAASNALGTVNHVRRAAKMAHSLGAQIFVDAVHYAPHQLIDVCV